MSQRFCVKWQSCISYRVQKEVSQKVSAAEGVEKWKIMSKLCSLVVNGNGKSKEETVVLQWMCGNFFFLKPEEISVYNKVITKSLVFAGSSNIKRHCTEKIKLVKLQAISMKLKQNTLDTSVKVLWCHWNKVYLGKLDVPVSHKSPFSLSHQLPEWVDIRWNLCLNWSRLIFWHSLTVWYRIHLPDRIIAIM